MLFSGKTLMITGGTGSFGGAASAPQSAPVSRRVGSSTTRACCPAACSSRACPRFSRTDRAE